MLVNAECMIDYSNEWFDEFGLSRVDFVYPKKAVYQDSSHQCCMNTVSLLIKKLLVPLHQLAHATNLFQHHHQGPLVDYAVKDLDMANMNMLFQVN